MARKFTNKVAVVLLGTVSVLAFSSTAHAHCGSSGCNSASIGTHPAYNPPALSSWSSSHAVSNATLAAPVSSYSSGTTFGSSASVATAPCPSGSTKQADGTCLSTSQGFSSGLSFGSGSIGSGSISQTFTDHSVAPLRSTSVAGLGFNESLQSTNCPVAVHNPDGRQVLGCYNIVKPAPQPQPVVRNVVRSVPTVYQVTRPIVQVPYPVAVPCGGPEVITTRYGFGNFNSGCGR